MKKRSQFLYLLLVTVLIIGSLAGISDYSWGTTGSDDEVLQERLEDSIAMYPKSQYALVDNQVSIIDPDNDLITPFIQNGRILVPVRFISEALGAKVSWNQNEKTVGIVYGDKTIRIRIYSQTMSINNGTVKLDVPAMITGGRTFIPARALSEALGKEVFYDKGLVVISSRPDIFDVANEKLLIQQTIDKINILPTVGTRENLVKLLGDATPYGGEYTMMPEKALDSNTSNESAAPDSGKDSAGFSTTNIQVEGVDEGDIVKTDGAYIYQVSNQDILIYKAYPTSTLDLASRITFDGSTFSPAELYIKDDNLIVIGSEQAYSPLPATKTAPLTERFAPIYQESITKVLIYNVSDKSKPDLIRELSTPGNYLSSRLIGGDLYFLSNQYIYNWSDPAVPLNPEYTDSIFGEKSIQIPYEDIRYIPPIQSYSYLMVASVSLDELDKAMSVSAYLGAGQEIYVSQNNLYITVNEGYGGIRPMIWSNQEFIPAPLEEATLIYKFKLGDAKTKYLAKGQVTGRVLNQFSMDEHNGYFRIATTVGPSWMSGENDSGNNVYILNDGLNVTGKLENLAKGETIYSVRFINDRGYVVTFRTVDPLFVIDLKDPKNPTILGTLKIPGYSNYLHPYDENHLIGFGKDTITVPYKDSTGKVISTTSYYMGMKVALFDVTDVSKPVQQFSVSIGDRGTDSELLYDHKALLFDKNTGLLAFPVNETKVSGPVIDPIYGYPSYGQLVFSGAYVYNLDLQKGFMLKGKISQLSESDYQQSGYYDVDYNKQIRRILYIDNVLYGVSNDIVSAYDLNNLKELASAGK